MKNHFLPFLAIHFLFFSVLFGQNSYLEIKGADSISKTILQNKTYQNQFKNIKELHQEVLHFQKQLFNSGYFNQFSYPLQKTNDSIYILKLQVNQKFEKITILHHNNPPQKILRQILHPETIITQNSFTCNTIQLEENLNHIIQYLSNSGKTFSNLHLENIQITNHDISADLKVRITKENRISNIVIKGYEKFPKKFIKHYLKIKPKQALNIHTIEKKSHYLNNIPFSSELKKPEILFSKDSISVYLYVKRQKSNTFDGFIGFNSNTENQKLEFNGNVNLKLINNLNTGEELHLKYLSTADEQKKVNLKIKLPYLLNSPFSLETELDIFKKDSTFSTQQQSINFKYPIHQNINIGIETRFTTSNTLKNTSIDFEDYKKTTYTLNVAHLITQQNNFFKTKNKTTLKISSIQRKTTTGNTPQQSIYLNSAHIINLNPKNFIYLKNESYYLFTENALANEMHFIGGINSIRGFQENSIPSYIYSYLNTEYRIQLNKNLYTHTIFDYGITKTKANFNTLYGFGFGFALKTRNNLLKLVFANHKTNNEKIKFSDSKIHLSLNTSF